MLVRGGPVDLRAINNLSFDIIPSVGNRLTSNLDEEEESGQMPALVLFFFRFFRLLLSGHQAVAIENAALRFQLAAFQRKRKRPVLKTFDRVFWTALRRLWSGNFWARWSNRHRRRSRPGQL